MRWKILCVLLLACALALGAYLIAANIELRQAEKLVGAYVAGELKLQGYQPGRYKKPTIPDAPPGSKPVAHVAGTVHYAPTSRGPEPRPSATPALDAAQPNEVNAWPPSIQPCDLTTLDVSVKCVADLMAEPTKPYARLVISGKLVGFGQVRELPPTTAGEISLEVAPAVVPPRWRLDLLAGLAAGERNGMEIGASWGGRRRLGGYALVEYQPPTWRVHGGIRFRLK